MSREKLPRQVSLPEVPRYSDNIIFGNLGLPVGFDQARMMVNLRAFGRLTSIGAIDNVAVISAPGSRDQLGANINSVSKSGEATLGAITKRDRKPLSRVVLEDIDPRLNLMGRFNAIIGIDTVEVDTRIDESANPKEAFDPVARASYLDQSIKYGLKKALVEANLNKYCALIAAMPYGVVALCGAAIGMEHPEILAVATGPAWNAAMSSMNAYSHPDAHGQRKDLMKGYRHSLFIALTADRWAASRAMLATTKLIGVRK